MTKETITIEGATGDEGITRRNFLTGVASTLLFSEVDASKNELSHEKLENAPFSPESTRKALDFVVTQMRVGIEHSAIAPPHVIRAESLSDEEFKRVIGFDVGDKRTNIFKPPETIYLNNKSRMHNLVHEVVHYIQYAYQGITDGTTDDVEKEAIRIQHAYQKEFSDVK